MGLNPLYDLLRGFNIGRLNIDCADAELLLAEKGLVVRRHVVFDEITITIDLTNKICFITAMVEVAMTDLSVVIGANGVIALANMHHDVHVVREAFD